MSRPAPVRRTALAPGDLAEALAQVERQRRAVAALAAEAERRRKRAAGHVGGPLDPRAQGLWHAADFHAARLAEGRRRLAEVEVLVARLRAAVVARPEEAEAEVRPCG